VGSSCGGLVGLVGLVLRKKRKIGTLLDSVSRVVVFD